MNTQFVETRLVSYILAFLHVVNINDTTSTYLHCSLLHIGTQSPIQYFHIRILAFLHVVNINDTTSTYLHCSLLHIGTQSPIQYFHIIGRPPMAYYCLLFCLVHWGPETNLNQAFRWWFRHFGALERFFDFLGPRNGVPAYFHHCKPL